jgi:hypothetical protein
LHPLSHASRLVANRHVDSQVDEDHTVTFSAADARFLITGASPHAFLLLSLRVHAGGKEVASQAWVGMPSSALFEALGPPYRSEGSRYFYSCGESEDNLAVEVQAETIDAVEWLPYVD